GDLKAPDNARGMVFSRGFIGIVAGKMAGVVGG
ncbi:unnamed protein product, partial [marine sediment metagenome]